MVGWEYQRIGNPVYSVQNHAEQVNNAIAAQADAIATSLESAGLVQPFERGLDQGIAMIITDQGIQEEADALGLHIINQDEFNAGIINGTQAATFAHELTGKTEGIIVLGNGNPGSTSIDKRQNGSKLGIEQYNAANGTSYQFEAFPDSSFGELTESIQKWTAQIDQKGDPWSRRSAPAIPTRSSRRSRSAASSPAPSRSARPTSRPRISSRSPRAGCRASTSNST